MLSDTERAELVALRREQAELEARYPVRVACLCLQCERVFERAERAPFCSPGCAAKWEGRQAA